MLARRSFRLSLTQPSVHARVNRASALHVVRRSLTPARGFQTAALTDRVRHRKPSVIRPSHHDQQETITRLLYSLGSKNEVERHLRIFASSAHPSQPAKFAVIKVGGGVLAQRDELALSLSFLARVGLYPVVLHGAGPQLNQILEGEGVRSEYIDGIRVTGMSQKKFVTS